MRRVKIIKIALKGFNREEGREKDQVERLYSLSAWSEW